MRMTWRHSGITERDEKYGDRRRINGFVLDENKTNVVRGCGSARECDIYHQEGRVISWSSRVQARAVLPRSRTLKHK